MQSCQMETPTCMKSEKIYSRGERNTTKNLKSLYGYYYITTNLYEVYNASYFPSKLTYNKFNSEMTGTLEKHKPKCGVGQGHCQTPGGFTYTFYNLNKDCTSLEKKLATNVTAYMHTDSVRTAAKSIQRCQKSDFNLTRSKLATK